MVITGTGMAQGLRMPILGSMDPPITKVDTPWRQPVRCMLQQQDITRNLNILNTLLTNTPNTRSTNIIRATLSNMLDTRLQCNIRRP